MINPTLQPDEVILFESKPNENLKRYWFYAVTIGLIFTSLISIFPGLVAFTISVIGESVEDIPLVLLSSLFLFFVLITIFSIISNIFIDNAYSNRYYWVTNKRVIYRRGIFGYQISSIPMNRISDVIFSKTFLENLARIESLKIQTLAGQVSSGRGGSEADFSAIPEAEKVQSLILDAMRNYK